MRRNCVRMHTDRVLMRAYHLTEGERVSARKLLIDFLSGLCRRHMPETEIYFGRVGVVMREIYCCYAKIARKRFCKNSIKLLHLYMCMYIHLLTMCDCRKATARKRHWPSSLQAYHCVRRRRDINLISWVSVGVSTTIESKWKGLLAEASHIMSSFRKYNTIKNTFHLIYVYILFV